MGVITTILMALAQDPPSADASTTAPVIITLAIFTLVGTIITATAPSLLEFIKNRGKKSTPEQNDSQQNAEHNTVVLNPVPTMESAREGLDMVRNALSDAWQQRDSAVNDLKDVESELDDAQDYIQEQAVYIAQLEGRLGINRQHGGRHGLSPDKPNRNWG